ncbi:MAG: 3-deoxy-D-manno-octulosonic acid transferase, partial [Alphaproteobacteria bacterium]|nr:3-deoxy-D-manno-octulosonic acid transferase [Alphaproteobacteria bacterium]
MFLKLYRNILRRSDLVLEAYLNRRLKKGKEDPKRFDERKGISSIDRPSGILIWIHAASVGEAQSALILIKALNDQIGSENFSILVTSVTRTSAGLMAERLPDNAF